MSLRSCKISERKIWQFNSYLGATLNWFGRELTGYNKTGLDIDYTYDTDGLRGTKTINGAKTEYLYVGGILRYEKRGTGEKLYYFYDAGGKLNNLKLSKKRIVFSKNK